MGTLDSKWRLSIVAVVILAQTAARLVAIGFTPILLRDYPLLLLGLSATNYNLLLVSNKVDYLPFLAIAVLRRFATDPVYFLIGRWYGDHAVNWIGRRSGQMHRIVEFVQGLFVRVSWLTVFLFPNDLVSVLAGSTRMSLKKFVTLDLAGAICMVILLRIAADAASKPISAVLRFNDEHTLELTVAFLLLTLLVVVMNRQLRVPFKTVREGRWIRRGGSRG